MNDRIQELAKQLGPDPVATIGNWGRVEWADNIYPQLGDRMYAAVDLEKFAELIVRECIGIVKQRWINPDEDVIAEEIKQHFGVEE
jgi:hypothetical protein